MTDTIKRDLGEQPITHILQEHQLTPHNLVDASTEQISHKMVTKACKGRLLSANVQNKILRALNKKTGKNYTLPDVFNYGSHMRKMASDE